MNEKQSLLPKKATSRGRHLDGKNNNTKNTELEVERGQNEQRGIGWCDGKSVSLKCAFMMRAELLRHLCRALMRLTPDLLILDRHLRVYSPWAPSYCSLSTFPLPFIFFPLISFPFMHPLLLPACPHAIFSPFLQCWSPPNSKQMCTCVHMCMCVKEKECSFLSDVEKDLTLKC